MTHCYVPRNTLKPDDRIQVELRKDGNLLVCMQDSPIVSVQPSPHHNEDEPTDEVTF